MRLHGAPQHLISLGLAQDSGQPGGFYFLSTHIYVLSPATEATKVKHHASIAVRNTSIMV
jgi:hypothetical protein